MRSAATFPTLEELVAFFGCDPELLDEDVPWSVNRLTFRMERGGLSGEVVIEPASGVLDVSVLAAGVEVAGAQVRSLGAVVIHADPRRQTLSAQFGIEGESTLWLTVRPEIRLGVEARDGTLL